MNATTLPVHELPGAHPEPGLIGLAERGLIPDALVRLAIRRMCTRRLAEARRAGPAALADDYARQIASLRDSPVAIHTDAANAQHYELPPAFFHACLGPRLKYSCCHYSTGRETLAEAEDAMLALYGERAELADGQRILELGCGWGSLTLWMAQRYPRAQITAISNSHGQRRHIEAQCHSLGLGNVRVLTLDVNTLADTSATTLGADYDRCVSVEMFEHMRNYRRLLAGIAQRLRIGGKLFVHIFAHRSLLYPFVTDGDQDWMAKYFFTGGLMPAADTLLHFQDDLRLERRWLVDGRHYQRTADHWLASHDRHQQQINTILSQVYGSAAPLWNQRWRMFWMACAEVFGYDCGREWLVAHYRFTRPQA